MIENGVHNLYWRHVFTANPCPIIVSRKNFPKFWNYNNIFSVKLMQMQNISILLEISLDVFLIIIYA